ncbi:Hsp20/alpha crystallin family protein [Streptomyces sp. CT34]|uniref:Hsp20/alpha crystallin family protein n=1 Tax=Streptomyces sp. CT34 TaxID=1553907 RepID=UPI0005B91E9C|nr:Hsp20/alpha crystallin family protein [Streptomyces sp. CT34]
MNMPVRRRTGSLLERALPSLQWGEPIAAEFDDLYERMSHLLETVGGMPALSERTHWAPLADLHETDDAYVVEAELPGMKRDGIDVEITDRDLRISGEYKECQREGVLRRSTRRTGRFEYRSTLPVDVKTEDIKANLTDGVLTVTLPKAARAATSRHIDVTT